VNALADNTGEVIGTQGFYIDVTPTSEAREAIITEVVAEFADNRAVIEQVKGILCLVYYIEPDAAFDLLKWRSQETNVRLRVLAEQLMADIRELEHDENLPPRSTFDRLLLSVHQRVRAKSAKTFGDRAQHGDSAC
jgi:ANTAR domain